MLKYKKINSFIRNSFIIPFKDKFCNKIESFFWVHFAIYKVMLQKYYKLIKFYGNNDLGIDIKKYFVLK